MPIDLRLLGALALTLAWSGSALAQTPPPPIPPSPGAAPPPAVLLDPRAEAHCDGASIEPLSGPAPPPGFTGAAPGATVTLAFAIDAEGRTRDIRPATLSSEPQTDRQTRTLVQDEGLQATLAGWRFPAGARENCRLTVRYETIPVEQAPFDLLVRFYAVARTTGPAREAVARRLSGPGATCERQRAAPRRAAFPDFGHGRRAAVGVQDWTVARWNMTADGRPADIETLASSGDADFDAEVRQTTALLETDPVPPLTGCLYNWFRRGAVLPAPPMPSPPVDDAADCPAAMLSRLRLQPSPTDGQAFLSRGIEGWALVRFDIAPWGEVGAVEVVDAQPAAALGQIAQRIVAMGRAEPGPGAVRCVQPVVFRVPPDD